MLEVKVCGSTFCLGDGLDVKVIATKVIATNELVITHDNQPEDRGLTLRISELSASALLFCACIHPFLVKIAGVTFQPTRPSTELGMTIPLGSKVYVGLKEALCYELEIVTS